MEGSAGEVLYGPGIPAECAKVGYTHENNVHTGLNKVWVAVVIRIPDKRACRKNCTLLERGRRVVVIFHSALGRSLVMRRGTIPDNIPTSGRLIMIGHRSLIGNSIPRCREGGVG